MRTIKATYHDASEFVLDPKGYFLIRIVPKSKTIEAGFCDYQDRMKWVISGKKPIDIYTTLANKMKLPLRRDHYAYLGRELEKAYHCLMTGLDYVQDEDLHFMRSRSK